MQFMMLMIPAVYQGENADKLPENFTPKPEMVEKMMKFNEELSNAGLLKSLNGLHPIKKGARVSFSGGATQVTDGPFIETKEVLGGYWIVEANSKQEVVEWIRKCPAQDGDVVEIRQIFDASDF